MKDLSFLLKKAGGTYQRLILEEQRYRLVVSAVEEHRELILREAWPRMEAVGMRLRDSRPEEELIKIIGPGTTQRLRVTVEAITNNVDEDLVSLKEVFDRLKQVLQLMYPRETIITFSF